jgi:hypothetical protein
VRWRQTLIKSMCTLLHSSHSNLIKLSQSLASPMPAIRSTAKRAKKGKGKGKRKDGVVDENATARILAIALQGNKQGVRIGMARSALIEIVSPSR